MSPPINTLNPSQAVERIREIIVGRHLERLEQRFEHLESNVRLGGVSPQIEDRLCSSEARLEALQQSLLKSTDQARVEMHNWQDRHREDIQQLAAQIQQVAAMKRSESEPAQVQQLEGRIGAWLNQWQGALQNHLNAREQQLANQIREEVATLWENTESQITRLQSRCVTRESIEEKFNRIAAAARALADAATSTCAPT